jgi:hypothetical protein
MVFAFIFKHLDPSHYEKIILPYEDLAFKKNESPDKHHFRTQPVENPVMIYRKKT